jgi:hypothetical protein
MFFICGYDFLKDENTLNPSPLTISQYNSIKLENGIFSHWYVTSDGNAEYISEPPTVWDYLTIMNANMEGTLEAGNIGYFMENVDGIRIKRRKVGEFNWITLNYISLEELSGDIGFTFNDNLAQNGVEYEYGFFPVAQGIEGNYISNTIFSKFNGVFICDLNTIYKFDKDVEYGALDQVQKVGVFEPFGRKYPVVVTNGLIDYAKGSLSGTILNDDFNETKQINREKIVEKRNNILKFFNNKKAKILKDWNGNYFLMIIVDSPKVDFVNFYGMGINKVNASWAEIGDPNNQQDLYNSGIIVEAN